MKKRKQKEKQIPNKKEKRKKKIIIFVLLLVLAALLIVFALKVGNNDSDTTKKVVDKIDDYDYSVSDVDTQLFKDTFKKLKKVLNADEVDKEEYASLVSQLFIIDFYTLSNKSSSNDVGAVQFVYTSYQSDFVDAARAGMYKQVQSNLNNDRDQDLPEVESVNVDSIEKVVPSSVLSSSDFESVTDESAYQIEISWTYTEDNDFQTSATMLIVEDGIKLSVAKLE